MIEDRPNDEIKEILDKMKDYSGECHSILAYSICGYKKKIRNDFRMCMNDVDRLLDYINNLQKENERFRTQLNTYENPDDLTLFYMWLDEKAKDKMKELQQENEKLKNKIEEITKIYQNESRYRTDLETKYFQLQKAVEEAISLLWESDITFSKGIRIINILNDSLISDDI